MRRTPVILTAVVGLLLLGVAAWCIRAVQRVDELRAQIEVGVGVLVQVQGIQNAMKGAQRPDQFDQVTLRVEELARTLSLQRAADDPVLLHARAAAKRSAELSELSRVAERPTTFREDISAELDEIVPAVRHENASISSELAGHWSAINYVVAIVVSLCGVITALAGYLLCFVLPRARETNERLNRLATSLAGRPSANGISHGVGGPLTVALTSLQLLRERFEHEGITDASRDLLDDALRSLARATGTLQDLRGTSQVDDEPSSPASPAPRSGVLEPASLRILLIDDDELVAASTKRVLVGHKVETEHEGGQGIARALAEPFDLILCDLMMPGRTGMDVFRTLQQDRPQLLERFVVMSGGANDDETAAFLDEYRGLRLDKPFGAQQLRELVARFDKLEG